MRIKLAIGLLITALLATIAFFCLPLFIDQDLVKKELTASFKEATGFDLDIQGGLKTEAFPSPQLVISSLFIHNAPTGTAPYLMRIRSLTIKPVFGSLFSGSMRVQRITADGFDLQLERLRSGEMNWEENKTLETALSKPFTPSPIFANAEVELKNGEVHYKDAAANQALDYDHIGFTLLTDATQNTLSFNAEHSGKVFTLQGTSGAWSKGLAGSAIPVNMALNCEHSSLTFQGETALKSMSAYLKGTFSLATDNGSTWLQHLGGTTNANPALTKLPVEAKGEVLFSEGMLQFPSIALSGPIIKGTAKLESTSPKQATLQATLDTLDIESILASGLLSTHGSNGSAEQSLAIKSEPEFQTITSAITINDALYRGQHIKEVKLDGDITGEDLSINQASALLPGNARTVFTGLGKYNKQGLVLEGQLDVAGDDFLQSLSLIKPSVLLPPEDFKRFRLKANTVISPKEIRFSELTARIESLGAVGGVIIKLNDRITAEAALRLGGVNIDHLISLWGVDSFASSLINEIPATSPEPPAISWLKQLSYDLALNLSLEDYTLQRSVGKNALFKLAATAGKINVSDLDISYNGSQITGNAALDITQALPRFDANLGFDTFNTAHYGLGTQTPSQERWSRTPFNLHWLDTFAANYQLKFGMFIHHNFTMKNVSVAGTVADRALDITSLTSETMGGQTAARIRLTGGKIPSLMLASTFTNIDTQQLATVLPMFSTMRGNYNASLKVETNGVDMYSWVSNASGALSVAGRNIIIQGFNLPGIMRAVGYVRTVADILNVVKRGFPGGETMLTSVDGNWNMTSGIVKSSNVKLGSEGSEGTLTSELDLVHWQMRSVIAFFLKSLDEAHPPQIAITYTGDIDNPQKSLDTHSLEQYVTGKTSEKLLQRDGTH